MGRLPDHHGVLDLSELILERLRWCWSGQVGVDWRGREGVFTGDNGGRFGDSGGCVGEVTVLHRGKKFSFVEAEVAMAFWLYQMSVQKWTPRECGRELKGGRHCVGGLLVKSYIVGKARHRGRRDGGCDIDGVDIQTLDRLATESTST